MAEPMDEPGGPGDEQERAKRDERKPAKPSGREKPDREKEPEVQARGDAIYSEADAISALNHVLRRRILRLLQEPDGPRSPVRTAEKLGCPLSDVAYHFKVLLRRRIVALTKTVPVRGAAEHFYSSRAAGDPVVTEMLERTREDDEAPESP